MEIFRLKMGTGYRSFTKFIKGVFPQHRESLSAMISGDDYLNKMLGVYIKKPAKWNFIFVKEAHEFSGKPASERKSDNDPDWTGLSEPAIILAKYKADGSDPFSPAIIIYFLHKNSIKEMYEDEQDKRDFRHIVKLIADGSKKLFKDHHFIKKHTPVKISGCKSVESRWTWKFEDIETKQAWICESWSLLIELNNYILSISMIDSKEAGELEQNTFEDFIKSIRIL